MSNYPGLANLYVVPVEPINHRAMARLVGEALARSLGLPLELARPSLAHVVVHPLDEIRARALVAVDVTVRISALVPIGTAYAVDHTGSRLGELDLDRAAEVDAAMGESMSKAEATLARAPADVARLRVIAGGAS